VRRGPGATERHAEQGESFPIDAEFMRRLFEELPDGTVRPVVVCRCEGEFAGGKILLELGDQAIDWISVADRDVDIPVTDLVDWWYITNAVDRGIESYDLAGANNPRLSRYKAKFAPDLATYYRTERGSGRRWRRRSSTENSGEASGRPPRSSNRCHATIGDCAISPLARPSALRSH